MNEEQTDFKDIQMMGILNWSFLLLCLGSVFKVYFMDQKVRQQIYFEFCSSYTINTCVKWRFDLKRSYPVAEYLFIFP